MITSKVLENIRAFNDVLYLDCVHNSMIIIARYYDKEIYPILLNDYFTYSYDANKGCQIDIAINSIKPLEQVMAEDLNVMVDAKTDSDNIILNITNAITNDRPVIIVMDMFFESIRPDTYQKLHKPHTLFIYGFDEFEELIHVIDDPHQVGNLFGEYQMSYSDIQDSVVSFHKMIMGGANNIPFFYEYYCTDGNLENRCNRSIEQCLKAFANEVLGKKEFILDSLKNLKTFKESFAATTADKEALSKSMTDLLLGLNNIINIKRAERYRNLTIFEGETEIVNILEAIIENWNFVRGTTARFQYLSAFDKRSFEISIEKIDQIYELEMKYNEALFKLVEKIRG